MQILPVIKITQASAPTDAINDFVCALVNNYATKLAAICQKPLEQVYLQCTSASESETTIIKADPSNHRAFDLEDALTTAQKMKSSTFSCEVGIRGTEVFHVDGMTIDGENSVNAYEIEGFEWPTPMQTRILERIPRPSSAIEQTKLTDLIDRFEYLFKSIEMKSFTSLVVQFQPDYRPQLLKCTFSKFENEEEVRRIISNIFLRFAAEHYATLGHIDRFIVKIGGKSKIELQWHLYKKQFNLGSSSHFEYADYRKQYDSYEQTMLSLNKFLEPQTLGNDWVKI